MSNRARGFIMVIAALIALFANVVDAANDGASVWNIVAVLCFAVVLFAGFELVAKNPES